MATVTLTPISAGFINRDDPMSAGDAASGFFATGHFPTPQTNRALLDFDLSGLGVDYTVTAATLTLTVQGNFLGASHTLTLYRVRRRWRGGTDGVTVLASWNNYDQNGGLAWTTAGAGDTTTDRASAPIGSVALSSANTDGSQVVITLDAAQVQAWIDGTFPGFGLLLEASDESGTTLMRWAGPQDATPANRPQLALTYTPASHPLTEGIIAYYKLDDTGYADASGGGHTLTPNNTPTSVTGKLNNAAHFVAASTQWLSTSDAALKLGDQDWTCCGWAKLTDNLSLYAIVSVGGTSVNGGGFQLFYHEVDILDYLVAQLYSDDILGDTVISDVVGLNAGNPPVGTWFFWAVRHDSVRRWFHLFADFGSGLSVGDSAGGHWENRAYGPYDPTTSHGGPTVPTSDWVLGKASEDNAYYLNGDVDEVGFWGRWLSTDELIAVRDAVAGGTSYPFSAGAPVEGSAALGATASLNAMGQGAARGQAALSAPATLASTARGQARSTVALAATATLAGGGQAGAQATVSLSAAATLTATVQGAEVAASAALLAAASLSAAAQGRAQTSGALSASAGLGASARGEAPGRGVLAAVAALVGAGQAGAQANASLAAGATLTARATGGVQRDITVVVGAGTGRWAVGAGTTRRGAGEGAA